MYRFALLLPLAGCVVYTPHRTAASTDTAQPTRPQPNRGESQGEHHARLEQEAFPDVVAAIGRADDALTASHFADALATARGAASSLATELHAKPDNVPTRESAERLELQVRMLEGLAFRGLGQDVDAAMSLGWAEFNAESCRIDLRPRCREYTAWLAKTFPSLVGNITNDVRLRAATSVAIAGELSDLDMNVSEREIQARKGYVGVVVEPTSKTPTKDGVILRVDGKTTQGSYAECNTVGQVQVNDQSIDVKRCHDKGYTAHRADFVATIPTSDAAKLTGDKGERLFLVFEVKHWRRSGNVFSSGPARVAYVVPQHAG
jgi:hypothetical protein